MSNEIHDAKHLEAAMLTMKAMEALDRAMGPLGSFVTADIKLCADGYRYGVVTYEDDHWLFRPDYGDLGRRGGGGTDE